MRLTLASERRQIKLFSVKEKKKQDDAASAAGAKKSSAGELRLQKDISELNLSNSISINFPNGKDDLMHFEITIKPTEGYYSGGTFVFTFDISANYPHDPPKYVRGMRLLKKLTCHGVVLPFVVSHRRRTELNEQGEVQNAPCVPSEY